MPLNSFSSKQLPLLVMLQSRLRPMGIAPIHMHCVKQWELMCYTGQTCTCISAENKSTETSNNGTLPCVALEPSHLLLALAVHLTKYASICALAT